MVKAKNLYLIIARDISTDAKDQMTSIHKVIEKFTFGYDGAKMQSDGVTFGDNPLLFPADFSIATAWKLDQHLKKDTILNVRLNLIDPNGKDFGGPEQENLIPSGIDRLNLNFAMQGFPITVAGEYTMKASMNGNDGGIIAEALTPITVELKDESTAKG